MGFMAEDQGAPGSTPMVLGSDLARHTNKRVAVMAIIESVDDEQVGKDTL